MEHSRDILTVGHAIVGNHGSDHWIMGQAVALDGWSCGVRESGRGSGGSDGMLHIIVLLKFWFVEAAVLFGVLCFL